MDLKDKIDLAEILPSGFTESADKVILSGGVTEEALEALTALGYSAAEAGRAVRQVEVTESMTVEDVLKASLKHLAFI